MQRVGLWMTFFVGFLAFNTRQSDAFALPKQLALAAGVALLWAGGRGAARRSNVDGPILALWVLALTSTVLSGDWPTAVFGVYRQPYHGLLQMAVLTGAFYAAARGGLTLIDRALRPIGAAVAIMGAYAVAQRLGLVNPGISDISGRVISTTGNPVFLGGVLATALPLLVHGALHDEGARRRYVWAAAAVFVVLPWTQARGAMLAAGAGLGVYLVFTRYMSARVAAWGLAVAGVAVVLAVGARVSKRASDSERIELWRSSVSAVAERPVLGWGPDCFVNAFRMHRTPEYVQAAGKATLIQASAHNDLVQAAVTLGLLGLVAYFLLLLGIEARARQLYEVSDFFRQVIGDRNFSLASASVASIVALFVQAKVNPVPLEAMVLGAFLAGALCQRKETFGRIPTKAFVTASLLIAALSVRLNLADALVGHGVLEFNAGRIRNGVDAMRRGNALAWWETDYVAKRCDEIFILAPELNHVEAREFSKRALRAAAQMAERRPASAPAQELMATSAMKASSFLGPALLRDSMRAFDRTHALDPLFPLPLIRKMEIAAVLHDRVALEGAREKLNIITQETATR